MPTGAAVTEAADLPRDLAVWSAAAVTPAGPPFAASRSARRMASSSSSRWREISDVGSGGTIAFN